MHTSICDIVAKTQIRIVNFRLYNNCICVTNLILFLCDFSKSTANGKCYQTFDKIPVVVYNVIIKQIFLNDFGETDCNIGGTLNLLMRKQTDSYSVFLEHVFDFR